jgi:hypothetical protein
MNRRRLVLFIAVLLFLTPVSILGFRMTRTPEELVPMTISKTTIKTSEDLTLSVINNGFKPILFGDDYEIHCVCVNGSDIDVTVDFVSNGVVAHLAPLVGSYSQSIRTEYEVGRYYILKDYTIQGLGEYSKTINFTILGSAKSGSDGMAAERVRVQPPTFLGNYIIVASVLCVVIFIIMARFKVDPWSV